MLSFNHCTNKVLKGKYFEVVEMAVVYNLKGKYLVFLKDSDFSGLELCILEVSQGRTPWETKQRSRNPHKIKTLSLERYLCDLIRGFER